MKILIIGSTNSLWTANYIKYVLCKPENEIWITGGNFIPSVYKEQYVRMGIHILDISNHFKFPGIEKSGNKIIRLLKAIIEIKKTIVEIKKQKHFDVIHVHFVSYVSLITFYFTKNLYNRSIATFWGSDLLRHGVSYFKLFGSIVCLFGFVTVATDYMRNDLIKKVSKINTDKIMIRKFGISILRNIDFVSKMYTVSDCKRKIGIPSDRYTIAIGYNKNPAHRHKEVIKEIAELKRTIKDRIWVVMQLTYGPDNVNYINDIINLLDEANIGHTEIFDFMDDEQIAMLRLAVDCFVHAQETDAFSATMIEYLYSDTLVVNSKNLKYDEISGITDRFIEFDDFADIKTIIEQHYLLKSSFDVELKERLRQYFSWECLEKQWNSLYKI